MSIPLINTIQLVSVLRTQLAQPAGKALAKPVGKQRVQQSDQQLAELIAARVRAIGADDPARGRKAFRVFLEAVLLSQFGQSVANDPRFFQLVEDVQREMESSPTIATMVATAISHLLNEGA